MRQTTGARGDAARGHQQPSIGLPDTNSPYTNTPVGFRGGFFWCRGGPVRRGRNIFYLATVNHSPRRMSTFDLLHAPRERRHFAMHECGSLFSALATIPCTENELVAGHVILCIDSQRGFTPISKTCWRGKYGSMCIISFQTYPNILTALSPTSAPVSSPFFIQKWPKICVVGRPFWRFDCELAPSGTNRWRNTCSSSSG